jgi:hypothetical protein
MSILDHAIPELLFYGIKINFLLISYDFDDISFMVDFREIKGSHEGKLKGLL